MYKMKPSVCGVGYLGIGEHKTSFRGEHTKVYRTWKDMLKRCYSEKYLQKYPSYKGCTVCNEWLNFQVFAEWFYDYYVDDYHLDKDILFKGNKIYSPETCCFVSARINLLLVNNKARRGKYPVGVRKNGSNFQAIYKGVDSKVLILGNYKTPEIAFKVYKECKENYIKQVAFEYYKLRLINRDIYISLTNYKISINN